MRPAARAFLGATVTWLITLVLPTPCGAQTRVGNSSATALTARLDSIVRAALSTSPIIGVSVAVVRGGDTLLHRSYGFADLGLEAPATPATTYRLVFATAAVGIMQQVEQGRLRLEDQANSYLPELDWQGRSVTVRQLLDMTSGLVDYHYLGDAQKLQRSRPQSQHDVASLFMGLPFVHEPGSGSGFTISGFHLAGMLLGRLTGQAYGDYLQQHVIGRAGLHRTYYCPDMVVTPGLATGYDYAGGGRFLLAHAVAPSHYAFLMTLCTNATGAVSLVRALRDGRLLRYETYREMITTRDSAASGTRRAVGLRLGEEDGHRWAGEANFLMGYNTSVLDFPEDEVTVAVLQNTNRPRAFTGSRIARELARATLGLPPLPPYVPRPEAVVQATATLSASERRQYIGTYALAWQRGAAPLAMWSTRVRIYEENALLMIHMPGVVPEPILYQGAKRFRIASDHESELTFELNDNGQTMLTFAHPSMVLWGPRNSQ